MRKKFLLMILILSLFSSMGGGYLYGQNESDGVIDTESELRAALTAGGNVQLGCDIEVNSTIEILRKVRVNLDLNGYKIFSSEKLYPINNNGYLTIDDNSKEKTGTIEGLGLRTGYDDGNASNTNARYSGAELTINGGTFKNVYSDEGAALFVYQGHVNVHGGKFLGQNIAISNTEGGYVYIHGGCYIDGYNSAIVTKSTVRVYETAQNVDVSGRCEILNGGEFEIDDENDVTFYQARIGDATNWTSYKTFAEALTAAEEGDEVYVFAGTYAVPTMKAGITINGELDGDRKVVLEGTLSGTLENLTLKNLHIKGANAQRWAYAKGDLNFENVTFEATSVYAIHFDGIDEGTKLLYKDCTIIGWAAMSGSPVSCKFEKCTIKDNGTYGVIRTYFDATIENCTFDIRNANTDDVYQDGIHAVEGAKVVVTKCANIIGDNGETGDMKDIVNVSGSSTVNVDGVLIQNPAKVGNNYYATIQDAIVAAAPNGTVELLADVTVDKWIMFSESLSIGNGNIITKEINGLTIEGNNNTLTIKSIESAGNGNRLFYDATNLNIQALTIECVNAAANQGGIGLTSGTISNVNFIGGGPAILPGTGKITVTGCTFKTNGTSIYYEEARDNLVVNGNTFENHDGVNVILLRGNTEFTNNIIKSGRTVNVVSGSPVVSGNDFKDVRFKVYNAAEATISNNTINNLEFNDESVVYSTFTANNLSVDAQAVLDAMIVAKIGKVKYCSLQKAIDAAVDGNTITLIKDVTEDVTITQKADLDLIIIGDGKKFTGVMTVFGDGRQNGAETLKIQNINFIAKNGATSCIVSPDRIAQNPPKYSYSHNVTVDNCTFTDLDGTVDCAAIRQEDGGDKNLTVTNCTVDATMHSLLQVNNVEGKLTLTGCTVKSKNGINLNSCTNVEMTGCNFDVQGYALRSGVKTGGNLGVEKQFVLNNNILKSACDDGDAVIMFRASSVDANFSMKENVVSGTTHISGNTAATNIAADENYWDGKEAPVVAEGSAPIVVNSYYSDEALSTLVRNEMGSIYAFVSSDRIFGDVTTNAKESIKIEIIGKDGNLIGTSSLENLSYATGFNKQLTWRINLGDDDSDSWAMAWEEGYPSINNMPAKVKLYVDDAAVAEAEIRYTADGDGKSPVFAAKTNAEGKINSFIACTGEYNLNNAANKLVSASADGDNIAILVAGTYNVPTGKNLTITGAVENVKFDMSNAVGIYSSMTFNNVTFEYGNANYKGLQHAGTMVYNNCTINGQVFLYGTSETFNKCTFNQTSSDAYNVWTYGAAQVAFNECTFNSAGKSVLIYKEETPGFVANVSVDECEFNATTAVAGKAAIEMDSSLIGGINLTIDSEDTSEEDRTTATGFGSGNVSGNSLWNNKMGNDDDANNDITVVVAGETVLVPKYEAQIGDKKFRNLEDAFAAVTDNTTLIIFEGEYDNALSINKSNVTVIGDGEVKLKGVPSLKGTNYNVENIDFVYSTGSTNLSGSGLIKDCSFTATAVDGNNFRYCYGTKDAMITFENCVLNAPMWAIHFDSAPGLDLVLTDCEINGRVALGGDLGSLAATGTTFENGYVNVWGTEDGATFTESKFVDVPYIFTGYDADNIVKFNDCEVTVGSDTSDVVNIIHGGIDNANALIYVDDVLMTGVAAVGNIHYATFEEALEAIDDNVTLTLLKNIVIENTITIAKNGVTLDGNNKTLTYTGTDRAIDVPNNANANIDVTVKNLTVVATTANRGLNYNENGKFNVEGVTVTIGEDVDGYAINFPGMADNAQVTIKDSKLTSRNPLNIWGENMTINVYDSEIISVENSTTYDYAAIQLNNDNYGNVANGTVVNVYRGTITALNDNDEPSNVVANATETGVVNISDETIVTGKVLNYVANIGGVYFGSLQAAVNAIEKYGYNSPIVIMKSFATSETATVKNDLNVTIDLNGKTITVTDNTTKNFEAIKNQGTLTIKDSSADKTGKITVTATTNSGWNRYSAVIANTVGGKLTVDGGTLEHLGGTDMAYGIDNLTNGKGTYAETVINGGTIKSTYRGIRQFLNGVEAKNILTVNGGTIEGANKSIWMQDPNANANTGTLTVGESASLKGDVYLYVTDGSTSWPVEVSIAAEALKGESTVMTANLPLGIDVQNINGTYGVVNVVAQIDGTYYQTFEAALNAVQNGETITVLNVVGSENKELDFTEDIEFTITGNAPNYALPVVTFQNATVNIEDATILIPELDARQDATINVINSTVYDAGGNSIAKSYYNGAINISGTSEVYMMQVTTMGYINISGTAKLHATWQTNVYGNGLVTIKDNATFNTAALHLTAKYYDGRDNTDADRVGKPAEIVVDGANFTVGKVYSAGGADYSYNSSKGINIGTIEGKSAILNIMNDGNVNIYMANGETANIGADGTVNIAASTLNTFCRAENGTATLTNNGTVNVTGAANLAANVTGAGWFYMNGVTLGADTKLLGAKVRFASGTNNIDSSTINDGFFQVGIGAYNGVDANVDTENGVIVNVKNAVVGANDDTYAGWAGTGFYDTDAEKVAAMTNAKYVLNIENSIAEFGYLHVSNDGELKVNGNATEKAWYNNSDYSFYAGDFIINGTATFDATDVLALYTKVSCDNGTVNPGTLNIVNGTEYEAERHNGAVAGLNFDIRKTGIVNVAEGANLHVGEPASIAADATMNIGGTATVLGELTNDGTINFTSKTATLTVPTIGLTVNNKTGNNDIKVVYENGAYKFIDKHYVAEIVGGAKYESLAEAVTAAQDGETIRLLWAQGDAPITMNASLYGKNVTITGTATVDWSKGFLFVGRGGVGNATLIFDGANLTSASNNASTGIHVSGREKGTDNKYDGTVVINNSTIVLDYLINKGTMTLDNSTLTVKNGFAVGGRPASETESGEDATATMTLNNGSKVVVNNHNGMGLGYEAIGIMNIDATSTFETTQNFLITANGTMNVNGGNVKTVGTLTNNGTVNINDATVEIAKLDNDNLLFISGENTFKVEDATGSSYAVRVKDGAIFNNSYMRGGKNETVRLLGSATFNGGFECAYLQGKSADESNTDNNGVGGTITIEEGTTVHATYGVDFSNNYVLNGGTIELSGGNANGGIWGCVFQSGEYTINSNVIVDGGGETAPIHFTDATAVVNGNITHSNSGGEVIYLTNSEVTFAENSVVTTTTGVHVNEGSTLTNKGNIAGNVTVNAELSNKGEINGKVTVIGTLNSENNITGNITTEGNAATIILTGGTYTQDVNEWCHADYDAIYNGNNTWTVIQVAGTQTTELITGWNWFSTYIKQGNDGLSLLQDALDTYGVEIKSREGFTRYYTGLDDWSPSQTLTSVSTTKMYMIKTSAAHTLELEGSFEDENVEITIAPGWNWIGYPVHEEGISFEDALSNIKPAHGDIIKSQSLYAQYIDMFGTAGWAVENEESLIMNPGEGYKYYSNKSQEFRFTYSTEVNSKRETSIETIDNYWLTDANQYSGNMTMLAMLSVDGEIVKGNYEVAAFANGECRGSARPIYIEALDAYVLLMTIHGEEVEELTFKYYDVNYGTEYELNNRINYSDDAIVGSFEEPYMFNLGILNIDETSVENISIYPNPTTTGKEINLQAMCDKVEVFNALGVKVAEYTNVDSIDAIETAGIYVIRVTIDGNARNCRLIVK